MPVNELHTLLNGLKIAGFMLRASIHQIWNVFIYPLFIPQTLLLSYFKHLFE